MTAQVPQHSHSHPVRAVLNWLRAGYPEGVPPTDVVPLMALLERRLSGQEIDAVVADLRRSGHLADDRATIAAAVERVSGQEATVEDVNRVAARLAAAGWPLAAPDANGHRPAEPQRRAVPGSALLQSIIGWLRAGYPEGVPPTDYIPLLALMRRRLTDEEIQWVADEAVKEGTNPFGTADIGVLVTKVTNELPSDEDIARVQARLEAAGWLTDRPAE